MLSTVILFPLPITTQPTTVLRSGSDPIAFLRCTHIYAIFTQFLVQLATVVDTITNQILRFGLDLV
jgi:hypothetical protein